MTKAIIILCVAITSYTFPQIINVPSDQPTIQAGIDAAENGDTVLVAEGIYFEKINFNGKAITVASNFFLDQDTSHISKTIIDGSQPNNPDSGSVVYFISGEDTTSVLMGFTITGGSGTLIDVGGVIGKIGGGIIVVEASAKICNNIIKKNMVEHNIVAFGGGLASGPPNFPSFIIIRDNIVDSNSCYGSEFVSHSGGINLTVSGIISNNVIKNNLVSSNYGEAFGGGLTSMYTIDSVIICNNLIANNKAESLNGNDPQLDGALGGGFMIWNDLTASIRIYNNIISGNEVSGNLWTSGAGGTFEDVSGSVFFENNLVFGNHYSGTSCHGTGISVHDNTEVYLINNTITKNEPSIYGGALSTWKTLNTTAINNIFWNNSNDESKPEIAVWEGKVPEVYYSNIQGGWEGEGNINVNPMFSDTLFHLSDSSKCIGRGIESYNFNGLLINVPEYDFDGNLRPNPAGSNPDIGALENERAYPLLPVIQIPDDYSTIQAGIDAAENGDTVLVTEGTYYENLLIENKAVTIASHFLLDGDTSHISKTIINGSQPINTAKASVITVQFSMDTTVICGLTITGGYGSKLPVSATEWARLAGGIIGSASNLIICHNRIIKNIIDENTVPDSYTGAAGGGIGFNPLGVEDLMVHIKHNLISANIINGIMPAGAGIVLKGESSKRINYLIEGNVISNNICINMNDWKAMGGGIAIDVYLPTNGTQIIRNNTISNNQAICDDANLFKHSFGGGMYILLMESSPDGSVDNDPGPYIYNNIISGNHSDYLGGGVAVWRVYWPFGSDRGYALSSEGKYTPKPSFINNTFVDNSAGVDGVAFYIMNHKPFLMNNILWDTYPENAEWGEIFLGDEAQWKAWVEGNAYGDLVMYNSIVKDGWRDSTHIWNLDPNFTDSTFYNISSTSPCAGNGISSIDLNGITYSSPSMDYLGNTRPNLSADDYVDIGAIESEFSQNPIVGVINGSIKLPKEYKLSQNYPNPFNPSTTIKYQLPSNVKSEKANVKLVVFDILGREVAKLVNQKQKPGNYEVSWDTKNQPSGVYFYQLTTHNYVETKKMIFLK